MMEMGYVSISPMKRIRFLKSERKPREYLTDEQVHKLLKTFNRTQFSEYRDYMITLLLLDTGMRLGECLCQNLNTLDLLNHTIRLSADVTKGRKARTVFFSIKTGKEFKKWLQYKERYCPSDCLFPSKQTGKATTISSYEFNFKQHLKRAKLSESISPHTLRNNFAKRCLMAGMDIYTLSRILGHSSVTITEKAYLDITDDDLKRKYIGFSPVEKLF